MARLESAQTIHTTGKGFNELVGRVGDLEEVTAQQIERQSDDMRRTSAASLLPPSTALRVPGTIALAVGLVCTTVANFV